MDRKAKITKRCVDGLAPEASRYILWDTEVSGFGIKVAPSGRKTYLFRYRVNGGRGGRSREPSIGIHGNLTPDQARAIARHWAADVAAGGDPAGDRAALRNAPIMAELLDRYLEEHVLVHNKARTAAGVRDLVERLIRPKLGRLKVLDVERPDIASFHAHLADTPYQANRALATLSKVFSLAEIWGLRPAHSNPCTHVKRFKEKSRERYLTLEEFRRLSDALDLAELGTLPSVAASENVSIAYVNPRAITAIRLTLLTGARIGEILNLRWEWIDLDTRMANLPDSKTGKKVVQLSEPVIQILTSLCEPPDRHGFVVRGGDGGDPERRLVNIKDPWGTLRVAAGIADVRIHDLRHAFASVAVANGLSLPVIGALLGHKEVRTTQRYAHLANAPLLEAADLVGDRITAAMSADKKETK